MARSAATRDRTGVIFSFQAQSPWGLVILATDDADADGRKESDLVFIDNDC